MAKRKNRSKKQRQIDLKLTGAICVLIFLVGISAYKYFFLTHLDSSSNGSEVKEKTQHVVPADVKQEIEKQKKLYALTELPTVRVPILMYHYVEYIRDPNDKTRQSLNTLPIVLDEQVKTLKQAGYTFMTAGELSDVLLGKKILPQKPIVLTFDDGYRDFYIDAYPILKKYNAKATQYVIAGFLDHPNHMFTSDLIRISKDGLVEIGAHTVTHVWLKDALLTDVSYQVTESKKILEKRTGKEVVSFAYPFGAFDKQATEVVKDAGFTNGVSTVPGISQSFFNRYFLYRLRPGIRTGEELLTWLSQTHFKPF